LVDVERQSFISPREAAEESVRTILLRQKCAKSLKNPLWTRQRKSGVLSWGIVWSE